MRYPFDYAKYFEWLCGKVGGSVHNGLDYSLLFMDLYVSDFNYILDEDSGRATKGQYLRYEYAWEHENGIDDETLATPCTMLEMLVKLAMDVEHYILGKSGGDSTGEWFWIMLSNIGLDTQDNSHYNRNYILNQLQTVLFRKYDQNGKGGLFPEFSYFRDARVTGLWQQASDYFSNYI